MKNKLSPDVIKGIEALGFVKDSYGHYKLTDGKNTLRLKLCKAVVRLERAVKLPFNKGTYWKRLSSAYYSRISVNPENGRLQGFKE